MTGATFAIGIEAGGSKTLGVLVDREGMILRRARSGGANVRSVGEPAADRNIGLVLEELTQGVEIGAVCVGAAGVDRPSDRTTIEKFLRRRLKPQTHTILKTDAQIALRAGSQQRPAVVVIAGTGSMVYGERADGSGIRCGGFGALIGDDGSGYAIGLAAIRHAARALDGVDVMGRLARSVLDAINASTVAEVIERIHCWPPDVGAIAALAPLVGDADEAGDDAAAQRIVQTHASLLGECVERVARAVRVREALPVILAGGAFDAVGALVEAVTRAAERTGPCGCGRLVAEPAVGAARIALDLLNGVREM